MKRIVICPDSFKGSLSASTAAHIIASTLQELHPTAELIEMPLADGGEGTLEIVSKKYPRKIDIETVDAIGKGLSTHYLADESEGQAFIESASSIGLPLISPEDRNVIKASSYGLGQTILSAIRAGSREIIVSLGGSATCDGGMGMMDALGFRFYDNSGRELSGSGENLQKVEKIDSTHVESFLKGVEFIFIHDVDNRLLGKEGAAEVFSPQKGATKEEVALLEAGLENLVEVAERSGFDGYKSADSIGTGAAGGLGFAFYCFLGGESKRGIDFILDTIEFDEKIKNADLIITGEGKLDCQSLMGKVVSGVLERAQKYEIPVVAVGGKVEDKEKLIASGLWKVYDIADKSLTIEANMEKETAERNLRNKIRNIFPDLQSCLRHSK
ncbi:MAG: glycerate kinase [Muribaculaceae bacterium]|nr:glycerate kinase [Muribaculaceae bacterium]